MANQKLAVAALPQFGRSGFHVMVGMDSDEPVTYTSDAGFLTVSAEEAVVTLTPSVADTAASSPPTINTSVNIFFDRCITNNLV